MKGMSAKKNLKINFNVPEKERDKLDSYAINQGRTMTDVLREFIRSLPEKDQAANATR